MNEFEEALRDFIKEKINYKTTITEEGVWHSYDGFNMSGFDDAHFHNLEIISRFKNYMHSINSSKKGPHSIIIPAFWKGQCLILKIELFKNSVEQICECNGDATEDIIFKVITKQNPTILKDLESTIKNNEEIK